VTKSFSVLDGVTCSESIEATAFRLLGPGWPLAAGLPDDEFTAVAPVPAWESVSQQARARPSSQVRGQAPAL